MTAPPGYFMFLPHGPLWESHDAAALVRFLDEFALRTREADSRSHQELCFEHLVRALGLQTCSEICQRVADEMKKEGEQYQQQQQPLYKTASSSSSNSSATTTGPAHVQPATLVWRGVPPIPATIPQVQLSTGAIAPMPTNWTLPCMNEYSGTGACATAPAAEAAPTMTRKRTHSSTSSSSGKRSTSAAVPATASGSDPYIPAPRNDGPWPYLGQLPVASPCSVASFVNGASAGGMERCGEGPGGGSGSCSASTGSDEDSSLAGTYRPAATNFGRYGDHLPYNGRKICRIKGCDGHQRWPDYLCGQHGGGRCRWEGCILFHQGVNSMGLLLCGKHCKAVGASYRRSNKADSGGGGGGGGADRSKGSARKGKGK